MTPADALYTVAVLPNGEVHLVPGKDFDPDEHMAQAADAVATVEACIKP